MNDMLVKCPACGSTNVYIERSRPHDTDGRLVIINRRCTTCGQGFTSVVFEAGMEKRITQPETQLEQPETPLERIKQ